MAGCCATILLGAVLMPTAVAGDEREREAPVTPETQRRIVERLLVIVKDTDEEADVRASAARSLGRRAAGLKSNKKNVRDALLDVVTDDNADPSFQIAASEALLESEVTLSPEHVGAIGETLWGIVIENDGADEAERRLRFLAVLELTRYELASRRTSLPPPDDVAAIEVLLAMSVADRDFVQQNGTRYRGDEVADRVFQILKDTEGGIRLLINALNRLEVESPEEISLNEISRRFRTPLDDGELARIREAAAERQFEEKREILVRLIEQATPKTEAIVQILLEAARHENRDVRGAAIEALGNEIPEEESAGRDEGARAARGR